MGNPRGEAGQLQPPLHPPYQKDLKSIPLFQDGHLDMSFFAPDCIHPSQKFHSQLSRALWVNMVK